MLSKRQSLFLLLAVCLAAGAWSSPLRVNRERLRVEGVNFVKKAGETQQNYLYIDDFTITSGDTQTIPVYLHTTVPVWMLQLDVAAPDGLTIDGVDLASDFQALPAASQYSLYSGVVNSGYRILLYNSTKTQSIPASDNLHIMDITITADADMATQTLTLALQNLELIDANTNDGMMGTDRPCTVTLQQVLVSGVAVDPGTITLAPNATQQLTATVQPANAYNQSVEWTTSNVAVATVDANGLVTAVAPGTATITATAADGSGASGACEVTVLQPATGITISKTTASIYTGETLTLTATVQPANASNNAVAWSTSNAAVATVDQNGQVTAIAPGTVTITAAVADNATLRATCQLTVLDYIMGDANADGTVTGTDFVASANYILDRDPQPFVFIAADVDRSGDINVSDLVGIADIAVHYEGAPRRVAQAPVENALTLTAASTPQGGKQVVTIALDGSTQLTALQLDLTLPEGMTLEQATLTNRASGSHMVGTAQCGDGVWRVLTASPANAPLAGSCGDLLTLVIDGEGSGTVAITSILAAETNATLHRLDNVTLTLGGDEPTAVAKPHAGTRITAEAGNIVVEADADTMTQIVLANGMSRTLPIKAGRNTLSGLQGVVIVRVNGQTAKFAL